MTGGPQTPAPAPRHTFLEAGRGHYGAAAQLAKEPKHVGPADHLAGLAAECAVKAMLLDYFGSVQDTPLGIPYSPKIRNRPVPSKTQQKKAEKESLHWHMPDVWNDLMKLADGRRGALILSHLPQDNPFAEATDEWSVDHRYVDGQQISKERVARHLEAARTLIAAYYLAQ
ncbi:hypothetical protein [Streptomyces sp. NPDC018693]|uniref:hypothetical protein n=1 Tax=unclassified Streptomyces TaxID=2593676 RepID=UPI0037A12CD5